MDSEIRNKNYVFNTFVNFEMLMSDIVELVTFCGTDIK